MEGDRKSRGGKMKEKEKVEEDARVRDLSPDDFVGIDPEGLTLLDRLTTVTRVASELFDQHKQEIGRMEQAITSKAVVEHGEPQGVTRGTAIKPIVPPEKRIGIVFRGEAPESSRARNEPREDVTGGGIDLGLGRDRGVPLDVKEYIDGKGGENIQLVCEKALTASDVRRNQNRFLMPHPIITSPSFLRADEREFLRGRVGIHMKELRVRLLEPKLGSCDVSLRRWAMAKGEGRSSTTNYVLAGTWNSVVSRNNLKVHDVVQLWSFRVGLELRLALVTPRKKRT